MVSKSRKSETKDRPLTPKQAMFCAEYLVDLNATQAAIRAGYSPKTAREQGFRLLTNVHIQNAVQERRQKHQENTGLTVERLLQEAMRLAFFDIRKLTDEHGKPIPIHLLDADTAAAIQGLDIATIGNNDVGVGEVVKYKIADKNSAIERLFKHLGLFAKDNAQSNPAEAMSKLLTLVNGSKLPVRK